MDSEINIAEYLKIAYKRKVFILAFVVIAMTCSSIYAYIQTDIYRSSTIILPLEGGKSSINFGALGGLAAMVGVSASGGLPPTAKLLLLLQSRTLAEEIVNRHDLIPTLFNFPASMTPEEREAKKKKISMEAAAGSLRGMAQFIEDNSSGTVEISGISKDPEMAKRVSDWFTSMLREFVNRQAMTQARYKAVNLEAQILQNQIEMLEASKLLSDFYKRKDISDTNSTIEVPMLGADVVNAPDISVAYNSSDHLPVEKIPASGGSTVESAGVPSLNLNDLAVLREKKKELEGKIREITVKEVPQQAYLEYLMGRVYLLKQIQGSLAQEYEAAKLEASSPVPGFQVIDVAPVPISPWKPNRRMVLILSLIGSIGAGLFLAFVMEHLELKGWSPFRV